MTSRHYSLPSFKDTADTIKLTQYTLHQSLIVEIDPLGNHEIYVVLNNTISNETIQQAIDNGHIGLLSEQSNIDVNVDDVTIENDFKYNITSPSPDNSTRELNLSGIFRTNWFNASTDNDMQSGAVDENDGNLFYPTDTQPLLEASIAQTMPAGTYEFYSDIDITSKLFRMYDTSNNYVSFNASVREGYLFRNTVVMPSAFDFGKLRCINQLDNPINFKLINRYELANTQPNLSIFGVNKIIGSDGTSIDIMHSTSSAVDEEVPTVGYVNSQSIIADEITIEKNISSITRSVEPDVDLVFKNSWDDTIAVQNITLPADVSFSNGVFTTDGSVNGSANVPVDIMVTDRIFYVIIDYNINLGGFSFYDSYSGGNIEAHDLTPINGTEYIAKVQIPPKAHLTDLRLTIRNGIPINFTLVDMNFYPPVKSVKIKEIDYIIDDDYESIDGTSTPMSDAHRELVTRSYVEKSVKVDKITIEKEGVFEVVGLETSMTPLIQNNWIDTTIEPFSGYSLVESDGKIFYPSSSNPAVLRNGNIPTFTAGTYEFYSDVDITYAQFKFTDSGYNDYFFNASVKEGSLYRNTLVLGSDIQFETFEANVVPISRPINIWIINRYKAGSYPEEITIKNIDRIIGSNGYSVDGDYVQTISRDKELVTKGYVDSRASDADETTLTRSSPLPVIATDASFQTVMNTAWDDNYATSGFSLKDNTTYLNGIFTCLSTDNGLMEIPAGNSIDGRIHHVVLNILLDPTNNEFVKFEDANNNLLTSIYDPILLDSGEYLYTLQIPDLSTPTTIDFNAPSDFTFKFVKMDEYPPVKSFKIKEVDLIIDSDNESIDGSDTPMMNAGRELVTRDYVDTNILAGTTASNGLTKTGNDIQLGGILSANTDIDINAKTFRILDNATTDSAVLGMEPSQVMFGILNSGLGTLNGVVAEPSRSALRLGSIGAANDVQVIVTNNLGVIIDDDLNNIGARYDEDYSANNIGANHDPRWIPDLGYMETYVSGLTNWLKRPYEPDPVNQSGVYRQELYPADTEAKSVVIKNNNHGITQMLIENSENDTGSDNYTGASIVLTTSSADYTNQTFISHHGLDHYDASLQGRGMIGTDSSLIISAYEDTDQQGAPSFIDFRVGGGYWAQESIFTLTTNGLEMPRADKKIFYEYGKTSIPAPAGYTNIVCDTATGELVPLNVPVALTKGNESHVIDATDEANQYIDLLQAPNLTDHLFVFMNGMYLDLGSDYTISTNRISFIIPIAQTDKVVFKYSY